MNGFIVGQIYEKGMSRSKIEIVGVGPRKIWFKKNSSYKILVKNDTELSYFLAKNKYKLKN